MGEARRRRRSLPERGYTVGITVFVKGDGSLALFENGLRQNVLFLYQLFRNAPDCARVFLLNHGDGEPIESAERYGVAPEDIVRTPQVLTELDYVVGLGAAIDEPTVQALRANGCRLICYKGGNGAVISMEAIAARPKPRADAELYFDRDYYDAIWMTPQHIHTYKGWCETIYRCPVHEVQQIWSPLMIEGEPAEVQARFGYRPGSAAWRVGVMDPNITVMKTSHLPMLVCEAAWRRDPSAFRAIYVTNALPYREDDHFRTFATQLQATRAGVLTAEPRFIGAHFLADHADAVVTHQWENGLNYLYYEVLWGGYPLIHNSAFLKDYGYYYPDFEAEAGAEALLHAHRVHDIELDAYRRRCQPLFERLNPSSPGAIAVHERLLRLAADHPRA